MDCEKFALEYVQTDKALSVEALAHAKSCPDCAELLALNFMIVGSRIEPDAELDRLILDGVKPKQTIQAPSWQRHLPKVLYAAAAALLLLLAVTALLNKPTAIMQIAQTENIVNETVIAQSETIEADLEALWYLNLKETDAEL